jgi:LuxR family maltose regulon positive regulatory protein
MQALTRVRLLFVRACYADILALLPDLAALADAHGLVGCLLEVRAFEALALNATGDQGAALGVLRRVLALAEAHGYRRLLLDLGAPMRELLAAFRRRQPAEDPLMVYVLELLAAFGEPGKILGGAAPPGAPAVAYRPLPEARLVEPLSERELQVLRLIAAGYSNREIADELYIGLSTVKTHINNIYGKLGVSRRTRAIVRARELRIL